MVHKTDMPPNVRWGALLEFQIEHNVRPMWEFVDGVRMVFQVPNPWAKDVRVIQQGRLLGQRRTGD